MSTVLQDRDGNESSKRLAGFIIAGAGLALLLTIGIVSIWHKVEDPGTAMAAGKMILGSGASLLIAGVIEHVGNK